MSDEIQATERVVVITGVSTGIGHATLHTFLQAGFTVYGSVRKAEDAQRLSNELRSLAYAGQYIPLIFDVRDHASIYAAARIVEKGLAGENLTCLINNAGMNCGPDPLELIPVEKFRNQFEVNVIGPTVVTQAFLPMLGTDMSRGGAPGKIIFVGSVYGSYGIPWQGPYCATKHALEGLSESLRQELKVFGIQVTIMRPGPTDSAIWDAFNQSDRPEQVAGPADSEIWEKSTNQARTMESGTGDWDAYAKSAYAPALATTRAYITEDMAKKDFYLPCSVVADSMLQVVEMQYPPVRVVKTTRYIENWVLPRWAPVKGRDWTIARQIGIKRATVEETPPAVKMYEADIEDDATVVAVKDSPEKKEM